MIARGMMGNKFEMVITALEKLAKRVKDLENPYDGEFFWGGDAQKRVGAPLNSYCLIGWHKFREYEIEEKVGGFCRIKDFWIPNDQIIFYKKNDPFAAKKKAIEKKLFGTSKKKA